VPPNVFDDYRPSLIIELQKQINALRWTLGNTEGRRDSHREQIDRLTAQIRLFETDRASHLEQINILTDLIHELQRQLAASESDRDARLAKLNRMTEIFASAEAEQRRRLDQIQSLSRQLSVAQVSPSAQIEAAAHAESLATIVRSLERECARLSASLNELQAKRGSGPARDSEPVGLGSLLLGWMKRT
jgi:chromosome segregation ATPase